MRTNFFAFNISVEMQSYVIAAELTLQQMKPHMTNNKTWNQLRKNIVNKIEL